MPSQTSSLRDDESRLEMNISPSLSRKAIKLSSSTSQNGSSTLQVSGLQSAFDAHPIVASLSVPRKVTQSSTYHMVGSSMPSPESSPLSIISSSEIDFSPSLPRKATLPTLSDSQNQSRKSNMQNTMNSPKTSFALSMGNISKPDKSSPIPQKSSLRSILRSPEIPEAYDSPSPTLKHKATRSTTFPVETQSHRPNSQSASDYSQRKIAIPKARIKDDHPHPLQILVDFRKSASSEDDLYDENLMADPRDTKDTAKKEKDLMGNDGQQNFPSGISPLSKQAKQSTHVATQEQFDGSLDTTVKEVVNAQNKPNISKTQVDDRTVKVDEFQKKFDLSQSLSGRIEVETGQEISISHAHPSQTNTVVYGDSPHHATNIATLKSMRANSTTRNTGTLQLIGTSCEPPLPSGDKILVGKVKQSLNDIYSYAALLDPSFTYTFFHYGSSFDMKFEPYSRLVKQLNLQTAPSLKGLMRLPGQQGVIVPDKNSSLPGHLYSIKAQDILNLHKTAIGERRVHLELQNEPQNKRICFTFIDARFLGILRATQTGKDQKHQGNDLRSKTQESMPRFQSENTTATSSCPLETAFSRPRTNSVSEFGMNPGPLQTTPPGRKFKNVRGFEVKPGPLKTTQSRPRINNVGGFERNPSSLKMTVSQKKSEIESSSMMSLDNLEIISRPRSNSTSSLGTSSSGRTPSQPRFDIAGGSKISPNHMGYIQSESTLEEQQGSILKRVTFDAARNCGEYEIQDAPTRRTPSKKPKFENGTDNQRYQLKRSLIPTPPEKPKFDNAASDDNPQIGDFLSAKAPLKTPLDSGSNYEGIRTLLPEPFSISVHTGINFQTCQAESSATETTSRMPALSSSNVNSTYDPERRQMAKLFPELSPATGTACVSTFPRHHMGYSQQGMGRQGTTTFDSVNGLNGNERLSIPRTSSRHESDSLSDINRSGQRSTSKSPQGSSFEKRTPHEGALAGLTHRNKSWDSELAQNHRKLDSLGSYEKCRLKQSSNSDVLLYEGGLGMEGAEDFAPFGSPQQKGGQLMTQNACHSGRRSARTATAATTFLYLSLPSEELSGRSSTEPPVGDSEWAPVSCFNAADGSRLSDILDQLRHLNRDIDNMLHDGLVDGLAWGKRMACGASLMDELNRTQKLNYVESSRNNHDSHLWTVFPPLSAEETLRPLPASPTQTSLEKLEPLFKANGM